MTVCEKLKEHLQHEGLMPEEIEIGLAFKYQMASFLHFKNDNDERFFNLCFPGIMKGTEDQLMNIFKAMNVANSNIKFANARVINGDEVWVFFESLIPAENADFKELTMVGLQSMLAYRDVFYQAFNAISNPAPAQAEAPKAE